jgi:hypothetical protein
MTNGPTYPIILTDNSTGYLDLLDDSETLTNSNVLGLIKGVHKNFVAYDQDGFLWQVAKVNSKHKLNGLTRFLAYTVYNPQIKVSLTWRKIGDYKIDDLKQEIKSHLDKDDDILTQFVEEDIIKDRISKCDTFDKIVDTLNKYIFKVKEDKLRKEKELSL